MCIFKNNVAYLGKKSKDKYISPKTKYINNFFKTLYTKLLFYGWKFTTQTKKKGVPMGIDPAPFWANLFLYTYEKYMSELTSNDKVKACHFQATKHFIDYPGNLNHGSVFNNVYKDIYPPELQVKVEHSCTHVTFLNLDIT